MNIQLDLATLSLLCLPLVSAATTYYVSPAGDDGAAGTSWATALKTPQAGFKKVHNQDKANLELVIAPGVYDLTDSCACSGGTDESRRVIIRGDTGNPADVTLKGNGKFEIVRLSNNVTVSDLTIANGSNSNRTSRAAGVRIGSAADNRLSIVSNCVVTGCHNAYTNKTMNGSTEIFGGPVYVYRDGLIVDSVVSNNTARYRGCGITLDGANATALRCTIEGNTAMAAGDCGVSVLGVNNGGGRLVDSVVQSNRTSYCAGARDVKYVEGCTFRGNVLDPAKGNHSSTAMSINVPTVVTNCTFIENIAPNGVGTIYVTQWDAKFQDCRFVGNSVSNYAAAINFFTGSTPGCRSKIENCVFADNVVHKWAGGGGAIRLVVGYVDVSGCVFTNNTSRYGGAIDVDTTGDTRVGCMSCTNCLFIGNAANDCGGGVRVADAARALFDDCKFIDNKATRDMGTTSSTADEGGGGVFLYRVKAGAYFAASNCVFSGNSGMRGGGFGSTWDHSVTPYGTIHNCVFTNNMSFRQGGGLSIRVNVRETGRTQDDLFSIRNSLFAFNRTTATTVNGTGVGDTNGGGILLVDYAPVTIENCTIVSNVTSYTSSGGLHMPWNGRLVNNIVAYNLKNGGTAQETINWNASNGATFTNCSTYPSTATVLATSPGYINADPKFVDPANGDFSLQPGSPCIDKGLDADWMRGRASRDVAGSIRISGDAVDIGCYERYFPKGLFIRLR